MVELLLAFQSNASLAHSPAVSSASISKDFQYALQDAFSDGFKKRRNKPAEMIARHIDKLMRKGQGSASDESFNEQLDSALALYRFTADKDVFRAFYHRALAKRLLLGRSASDDAEKAMLKKLKEGTHLPTAWLLTGSNTETMRRLRPRVRDGRPYVPRPRAIARHDGGVSQTPRAWACGGAEAHSDGPATELLAVLFAHSPASYHPRSCASSSSLLLFFVVFFC